MVDGGTPNASTQIFNPNSGGTPKSGGTLTMLGTGDVDYMDPNVSYYSIGYLNLRMWSRQLYTYPAVAGQTTTVVPDLATGPPTVTDNGLKYAVTIRTGAKWNTSPPRQVTAADVVRGVKRSLQPDAAFRRPAGLQRHPGRLHDVLQRLRGKVSATSAAAQAAYINSKQHLTGVTVDPSNPLTVDFTLTKPATYFPDILTLPPFAPAPVEILHYLPASNALAQHTISDGPYQVQSYDPAKSIVFIAQPGLEGQHRPDPQGLRQRDQRQRDRQPDGHPAGDLDQHLGRGHGMGLVRAPERHPQPDRDQGQPASTCSPSTRPTPTSSSTRSRPTTAGALGKHAGPPGAAIRHQPHPVAPGHRWAAGGPAAHPDPPARHQRVVADLRHVPVQHHQGQADAFGGGGEQPDPEVPVPALVAEQRQDLPDLQAQLGALGIHLVGVPATNADFYTKYLQVPSVAERGVWDLSLAGWSPDWYGDAAKSFFQPLFDGRSCRPRRATSACSTTRT